MLKDVRENRRPLKELRRFASDDRQRQSKKQIFIKNLLNLETFAVPQRP